MCANFGVNQASCLVAFPEFWIFLPHKTIGHRRLWTPIMTGLLQESCQSEIRYSNNVMRITKRCKQLLACQNNAAGNTRNCRMKNGQAYCVACCQGYGCNENLPNVSWFRYIDSGNGLVSCMVHMQRVSRVYINIHDRPHIGTNVRRRKNREVRIMIAQATPPLSRLKMYYMKNKPQVEDKTNPATLSGDFNLFVCSTNDEPVNQYLE